MKCANCGFENEEGSLYCEECGSPLGEDDMTMIMTAPDAVKVEKARLILDSGEKYQLRKGKTSIGRPDEDAVPDINVEPVDQGFHVSRKHGVFYFTDGRLSYEDHSINGSFVNGKRLEKGTPVILKNGDRIRFAKLEGRVELE